MLIVAGLVAVPTRSAFAEDARNWGVGATAYGYSVPDQPDFVMVVAPVDIRWFHIEGRYNYESLHTGSIFFGANASAGDKLKLDVTGMVGGVFGDVDGVAPAFRLTLSWWKLDFSTEDEYLIDAHNLSASFFYSWSESASHHCAGCVSAWSASARASSITASTCSEAFSPASPCFRP